MNIQEMMRQAQRMKKKIEEAQAQAESKTTEGSAGGGMVSVTANGKQEIVSISIEKEVIDPEDVDMLQDLIRDPNPLINYLYDNSIFFDISLDSDLVTFVGKFYGVRDKVIEDIVS